jgi:hypothetical protein
MSVMRGSRILVVLLCLVAPLFSYAVDQDSDKPIPKYKRARFVPTSSRFVTIRLWLAGNNDWFELGQYEGGMIRVSLETEGLTLAFAPIIRDELSGAVSLRVHQITEIRDKRGGVIGEALRELGDLAIVDYQSATFQNMPLRIELVRTYDTNPHTTLQSVSPSDLSLNDDECCVTCNGVTACACRVDTSCGTCCLRHCC